MLISKIYNSASNEIKEGLAWGLVLGLAWGLAVILTNFEEALPFMAGIYPVILLVLGIIVVAEIMFWLSPKEKVKKNIFWHTCKRKLENIFEVLLGLSAITQIYILIREIRTRFTQEVLHEVLRWVGYIGFGLIVLVIIVFIFYLWIKANEYKYKEAKK
jgi:SNF family Na+-dependent transporter